PAAESAPPASLVGREAERAWLVERLVPGGVVAVVGPGGIGKTRLAQDVVADIGDGLGGVSWVDLTHVDTVDGVHAAVKAALAMPADCPVDERQLGRALAESPRRLWVFDNADEVAEPLAGALLAWRRLTDELAFLCTSRRVLPGLPSQLSLPPLSTEAGRRLFVDRSAHPVASDAPVERLIECLDGLPLAIELAAARTGLLTVSQILERLDVSFELLRAPDRLAPSRHRSLGACLDASWRLLSAPARTVMAALSVFAGPFGLSSALEVLEALSAGTALDTLQELVDAHFLVREGADLRTLSVIRAFAGQHLEEPARTRAERVHGRWAASLEPRGAATRSREVLIACRRAVVRGDAELAARCFLVWLDTPDGQAAPGDAQRMVDQVLALDPPSRSKLLVESALVARRRGDLETCRRRRRAAIHELSRELGGPAVSDIDERWLDLAVVQLHLAEDLQDVRRSAESSAMWRAGVERLETMLRAAHGRPARPLETRIHLHLADAKLAEGDAAATREHGYPALAGARELGWRRREGHVLHRLAMAARLEGDLATSEQHLWEARAIHEADDDVTPLANVLRTLGALRYHQGDLAGALEAFRECLGIDVRLGSRAKEAFALGNIGIAQAQLGRVADSRASLAAALGRSDDVGHERYRAMFTAALADLERATGALDRAHERALEAVERARGSGLGYAEAGGWIVLGRVDTERGDLTAAADHFQTAQERFGGHVPGIVGLVRAYVARVASLGGEPAAAHRAVMEAVPALRRGPVAYLAMALLVSAEVDLATGRADAARNAAAEADALYRRMQHAEGSAMALVTRAQCALADGELSERVEGWLHEAEQIASAARARGCLAHIEVLRGGLVLRRGRSAVAEPHFAAAASTIAAFRLRPEAPLAQRLIWAQTLTTSG
ncbi:MAG: AAA family ATPase, partial [Myxococcota bacterium]